VSNPVLTSTQARRACTLSGLEQKRLSGKLIQLKDLEKTLDIAIMETTKASSDEAFWKAMEVSAKLVQVSCDLTIALLEEGAEKVGAGAGAKAVSVLYDVAKMVVDALNGEITFKKAFIFSTNAKLDAISEILNDRGGSYGKVLSRTKVLANLAGDLYDYWSEGGKERLTGASGLAGARKTALNQLMRVRRQIRETGEALEACAP
jgi:hypothetical protein